MSGRPRPPTPVITGGAPADQGTLGARMREAAALAKDSAEPPEVGLLLDTAADRLESPAR